jgi:uncharacterized protein (DUF697 family)
MHIVFGWCIIASVFQTISWSFAENEKKMKNEKYLKNQNMGKHKINQKNTRLSKKHTENAQNQWNMSIRLL